MLRSGSGDGGRKTFWKYEGADGIVFNEVWPRVAPATFEASRTNGRYTASSILSEIGGNLVPKPARDSAGLSVHGSVSLTLELPDGAKRSITRFLSCNHWNQKVATAKNCKTNSCVYTGATIESVTNLKNCNLVILITNYN